MSRSNIHGVTHLRGGRFDGPFSSALDTLSCLVLHSFGISVGVRVASCCRVFFSVRAVVWGGHILIGASCFTLSAVDCIP